MKREARMVSFGILLCALIITTWVLGSTREPNTGRITPEGAVMLPEPRFQGISLDTAIMQTNVTPWFSNNTFVTNISLKTGLETMKAHGVTTICQKCNDSCLKRHEIEGMTGHAERRYVQTFMLLK